MPSYMATVEGQASHPRRASRPGEHVEQVPPNAKAIQMDEIQALKFYI
jgi:hypothetical protein